MDELTQPLAMAKFDGGCGTVGKLINGPIRDFNVMTKQGSFEAEVITCTVQQTMVALMADLNFVYAINQSIDIQLNQENIELPQGQLLQISDQTMEQIQISGKGFIVISLQSLV